MNANVRSDGHRRLEIVLCGGASDAHTWNLVYLQLLLEEAGHEVHNLGPCVTPDLLISECRYLRPDLIVVASVNGHGHIDGIRTAPAIREHSELATTPMVIGGNLGISGSVDDRAEKELRRAGFDAVFHGSGAIPEFTSYVSGLAARTEAAC